MNIAALTSNRKLLIAVGVCMVVLAGGAMLLWAGWRGPPDPSTQSPEEVTKYLASEDFGKLSIEQKQQYLQQAREAGRLEFRRGFGGEDLSQQQRRQLSENMADVGRQRMRERLDAFFELPQDQRDEYIDRMLDSLQRRSAGSSGGARASRPDGSTEQQEEAADDDRPRRRGPTPEGLKRMLENTDPEDRARMGEFMKAMRKRMDERGMSPPGRR